jgi:dihydrodipicolinate synthase/N-acetylneuraminate lyase
MYRIVARFGDVTVAGYTVAMRVVFVTILPGWGMANAAATLVGQSLGAGKPQRAEQAVFRASIYNMAVMGAVTLLLVLAPRLVLVPLCQDPSVIPAAEQALRTLAYGFVFYGLGMVVVQALVGWLERQRGPGPLGMEAELRRYGDEALKVHGTLLLSGFKTTLRVPIDLEELYVPLWATIDLRGLWVPVVTPLGPDGGVDLESLARLAQRLLRDGATGLVALGTTGEPATLTVAERDDVVRTCAEVCRDPHRPLVVGVGTSGTATTVAEARHIEQLAAPAAVMVVVPPYTLPSEAGVVAHVRAVAAATTTPVVVYNVPHRTGRRLGAAALLDLAGTPGIVGLKQAVGGLDHDTLEVLRSRPATFQVLAGDDATIVPTILMGGSGAISAASRCWRGPNTDLAARPVKRAICSSHSAFS